MLRALPLFVFGLGLAAATPARAWPAHLEADVVTSLSLEHPHGNEVFPAPPSLRAAVLFWKKIFAEHPSTEMVIHDRDEHIVWRVIEMTQAIAESPARRREVMQTELDDVRARLAHLAEGRSARDDLDAALLAAAKDAGLTDLVGAHERVRSQSGIAEHFRAGLERSLSWLPKIQEILRNQGVPIELAALPFVESSFNPQARSSAGAAGLWQLMPATARGLGLKVGPGVDQRLDVLAATTAAAKMLAQNHRMLGTWPLALTAYNHGPNGVRRAVNEHNSRDLVYLIDNYQKSTWGFASKNFYAEFLAVLDIMRTGQADALLAGEPVDGLSGAASFVSNAVQTAPTADSPSSESSIR